MDANCFKDPKADSLTLSNKKYGYIFQSNKCRLSDLFSYQLNFKVESASPTGSKFKK